MNTFDFSPLYRTSVGFDRLASLLASAKRVEQGNSYPPYNIKATGENHYQITMAVAGTAVIDTLKVVLPETPARGGTRERHARELIRIARSSLYTDNEGEK